MDFSPIALFVYKRNWHTRQTIEALVKNHGASQSDLYIFSDAARDEKDSEAVTKVRDYIKCISGFKSVSIVERNTNLGLANSIIDGVSMLCRIYGKAIVIEDDIVTSHYFLIFMNEALKFYEKYNHVYSISGFSPPPSLMKIPSYYDKDVYLNYRSSSWGWATWQNRWQTADWQIKDYQNFLTDKIAQKIFNRGGGDLTRMLNHQMRGKIDSWYIRWCYTHYAQRAFCLFPVHSYVDNIGHDASGTHCKKTTDRFRNDLSRAKSQVSFVILTDVDKQIVKEAAKVWTPSIFQKLRIPASKLKRFLLRLPPIDY